MNLSSAAKKFSDCTAFDIGIKQEYLAKTDVYQLHAPLRKILLLYNSCVNIGFLYYCLAHIQIDY